MSRPRLLLLLLFLAATKFTLAFGSSRMLLSDEEISAVVISLEMDSLSVGSGSSSSSWLIAFLGLLLG